MLEHKNKFEEWPQGIRLSMASYRSTLLFAFRSDKNNNFLTFSKVFCFGKSNFLIKKELGYVDILKNRFDILETSSRRREKNPQKFSI